MNCMCFSITSLGTCFVSMSAGFSDPGTFVSVKSPLRTRSLHGIPRSLVDGLSIWVSGPRHRLDLAFRAKGQGAARYLPHGIVGQSFSTPTPRFGKVDRYPASGHFVTTAMAEGAIDGVAADYEVASPFDTSFSFSRFNAVVQEPLLDPGPLSLLEASAAETGAVEDWRAINGPRNEKPPEVRLGGGLRI